MLLDDALIGRVDCKVDRKAGVFAIRALHFEAGYVLTPADAMRMAATFQECATWHGAHTLDLVGIGDDDNGKCMRMAILALLPS
jgi:uncharacterized protein YcaQ